MDSPFGGNLILMSDFQRESAFNRSLCQREVLMGCAQLDAAAKDDGFSDSDARIGYRRTVVRLGPSSVSNGANADGLAESRRGLP